MDAGTLRHWVTLERLVTEQDSDGETDEHWEPAFDVGSRVPAEVTALSGRELIAAQSVHSKVTTRIVVRYRPGIDPKMRALLGGTAYNIEAVIQDSVSRRTHVTLLCSSGVSEGQ